MLSGLALIKIVYSLGILFKVVLETIMMLGLWYSSGMGGSMLGLGLLFLAMIVYWLVIFRC